MADAYARIAATRRADAADRTPGYVPSASFIPADYRVVWTALDQIHAQQLAPNARMCEWGSGLGVIAALAGQLGYAACGIESQPDLVKQARSLVADHKLPVDFVTGSYLPEAAAHLADFADDLGTLTLGIPDGYDELGHDPDDFGLIYVFPWPGEEAFIETLFDHVAADGTLLLTYHSTGDVKLQRKG